MRRPAHLALALCGLLAWANRSAWAEDVHAEMAAALIAQADLEPAPLALPTTAAAPRHAAANSAVKRGIAPRASDAAGAAANQVSQRAQAQAASQSLAHQAQAAAATAAGQAQSRAAKERAIRPRAR